MQFRIFLDIDADTLEKVVPPAYRGLARDVRKRSSFFTVLLFRHDINDVVRIGHSMKDRLLFVFDGSGNSNQALYSTQPAIPFSLPTLYQGPSIKLRV